MDLGLLRGSGNAPEPNGIIDQAEAVTGPTLIAAAGAGIAAIGEKGGQADTIALSPTAYVDRDDRRRRQRAADPRGRARHAGRADHRAGAGPRPAPGVRRPPLLPGPGPRLDRDPARRLAARRDHPARLGPRQRRRAGRGQVASASWRSATATAAPRRRGQRPRPAEPTPPVPRRAPTACRDPGCPGPGRGQCPDHPPAGSWGRAMPPGWTATRRRILRRDPTCRLCASAPSTEVHHTQPGVEADWALLGVCHPVSSGRDPAAGRHRPVG